MMVYREKNGECNFAASAAIISDSDRYQEAMLGTPWSSVIIGV